MNAQTHLILYIVVASVAAVSLVLGAIGAIQSLMNKKTSR